MRTLAIVGKNDSAKPCALAEAEYQANFNLRCPDIVLELSFVSLGDRFSGFEFENQDSLNHDVSAMKLPTGLPWKNTGIGCSSVACSPASRSEMSMDFL